MEPFVLVQPVTLSPPGRTNAKNYHLWPDVAEILRRSGVPTAQLCFKDAREELGFDMVVHADSVYGGVTELLRKCSTWACIDSFLQHLAAEVVPEKPGVVVFGPSDPSIFGYAHNINLTAKPPKFRQNQFAYWHDEKHDADSFPPPNQVASAIISLYHSR